MVLGNERKKYAVLTFDEPEFEPSYVGTPNEGKGGFCRLFFCGKLKFSDVSLKVYHHRNVIKASVYLVFQLYYALKSVFFKSETIFEYLEKYNVKGTFYGVFNLIDENSEVEYQEYRKIFQAIVNENHELGLHGYQHGPLTEGGLARSKELARELFNVELKTYSSPWGDDRVETEKLLISSGFSGFRVWNMEQDYKSDLKKIKYVNSLNGLTLNEECIVLNIHGPDMYPIGKSNVDRMIRDLRKAGYTFVDFRTYVKSLTL